MAGGILGDLGILVVATFGALPVDNAANTKGRLCRVTATGIVYRDSGSAWVEWSNDLQLGTTATTAAAGNDARLSDTRVPTAHKTSHESGGSDPIAAANVAGFDTQVRTSRLDQMAVPTADLNANSHKITNVTDPASSQDAATKNYVDFVAAGLRDFKQSVRATTTANDTLATAFANGQTIDGVTLVTGDRILLKNQTAGADNGIYTVNASGAPTRSVDADSSAEVTPGLFVFVEEGTTLHDTGWVLNTDAPITLGTTALVFAQFSNSTGGLLAANNLSDVASATTARTNLGLAIGTNVQAWDTDLDTWATKTPPSGVAVGTTDAQTLTNKALTTPTIGDLTNATHSHTNAAGGGSLGAAAIGSGVLAIARLATGTPDGTKFVRDDGTLAVPAGAGFANPMTTAEDIIIGGVAGAAARKAKGTDGQFLATIGGVLAWADYVTVLTPIIDGGGVAITTGVKLDLIMPWAGTIDSVTLLADVSGSIVLDLWKQSYASYPPLVAQTITASAKPTISSATKAQDATLTGWTKTFLAGDVIRINVDSVTTIQRLSVGLKIRRTA